jgi:hypothetical protein
MNAFLIELAFGLLVAIIIAAIIFLPAVIK